MISDIAAIISWILVSWIFAYITVISFITFLFAEFFGI